MLIKLLPRSKVKWHDLYVKDFPYNELVPSEVATVSVNFMFKTLCMRYIRMNYMKKSKMYTWRKFKSILLRGSFIQL
jgi:hypothetical protein